jgi:hypothetical protein
VCSDDDPDLTEAGYEAEWSVAVCKVHGHVADRTDALDQQLKRDSESVRVGLMLVRYD